MNIDKVVKELKEKYPGKVIVLNPTNSPTEIICEIEPTTDHPNKSIAIAIIEKSEPHVHKKSTEIYKIIKGTLKLNVNGKENTLRKSEKIIIKPGEFHSATGNETWVEVISTPGWTINDHHLVKQIFNLYNLRQEFINLIKEIEKQTVIADIPKSSVSKPTSKVGILLTTSLFKIRLLTDELLDLTDKERFFISMATLRMIFEELILLTFVLSKIKKSNSWKSADYVLTRVSIGRRTREKTETSPDKLPYNIMTTMEEAEKYIQKKDKKLIGIFEKTYTFISDFVHPNAPSRYYFWHIDNDKVKFIKPQIHSQDIGMILNYACMSLKLYIHIWKELNSIKLPLQD